MIRFSDATFAELKEIRAFLYERMYRHWAVQRMRRKARLVVRGAVRDLHRGAGADAARTGTPAPRSTPPARARVVADYIAGMTDRFALQEHRKLTDPMVKG